MRLDTIDISPIKVTIPTEDILDDLTYPAPAETAGAGTRDRGARRARRSPAAVEAAFS